MGLHEESYSPNAGSSTDTSKRRGITIRKIETYLMDYIVAKQDLTMQSACEISRRMSFSPVLTQSFEVD